TLYQVPTRPEQPLPQMLDVHGPARAPVEEPLLELSGAGHIGAAPDGLSLRPLGARAARRAGVGHAEWYGLGRTLARDHLHEIGDDVARALDEHGIADADVLAGDLVLVVRPPVAQGAARQLHRLQACRGSEGACLTHVDGDVHHARGRLAGGELEGNGPAWVV